MGDQFVPMQWEDHERVAAMDAAKFEGVVELLIESLDKGARIVEFEPGDLTRYQVWVADAPYGTAPGTMVCMKVGGSVSCEWLHKAMHVPFDNAHTAAVFGRLCATLALAIEDGE